MIATDGHVIAMDGEGGLAPEHDYIMGTRPVVAQAAPAMQ